MYCVISDLALTGSAFVNGTYRAVGMLFALGAKLQACARRATAAAAAGLSVFVRL